MSRFRYPVDTHSFKTIREQGKIYIDKTGLIYDLINKYNYVFLARPRRFGKSLLCTTLKAYFEGKKELFEGLEIAKHETEWKKFPVLHFSMSGLKNYSVDEAKSNLEDLIKDYEKIYGRDTDQITPGARFRGLIHRAYEMTGEKVVVIFDEYDAPIMRMLYDDQLEAMRNLLRGFYQVLKDEGEYLKFVFITGVTKFAQLSIFSELNNLKQISMDNEFSGLCGITQKELNTVMRPCVEEYATDLGISTEEAYALLKQNYDGYHFSKKSEEVYAPFSLLRALNDRETNYYWFESGTSTSLLEHLRHFPNFNVLNYDGVLVGEDEFNTPCEEAETPMPLLYQSGYLTIGDYDAPLQTYTLRFPNNEVRQGMIRCLMPIQLRRTTADGNTLVRNMARALFSGDLAGALTALRSYIAHIPHDIITKEEWNKQETREAFYKLLLYMAFSMLNALVDVEVKSILGRADVVIKTNTHIFVLELKVDKSVDDALSQIESKSYAIPYEADERTLYKCGVTITPEARNITHWRIVDAEGNIVGEEKFDRL